MKNCKSTESFCVSITQTIGPLFDMFTAAIFIFFCEILICASLEQDSISFDRLSQLDLYFMEVG